MKSGLFQFLQELDFAFTDGLLRQVVHVAPDQIYSQDYNTLLISGEKSHASAQYCFDWLEAYLEKQTTPFKPALLFKWNVSAFRQAVWDEVCKIPFGEVRTYADIAKAVGNPRAVRAVGTAIGRNPCFLFRPCHRVIAANGNIGGFALDLNIKRQLLEHEGTLV